jgi:multicomponent Na+:H+ antiporter subunit D
MTDTGVLASGGWLHPSLLLILGTLLIPLLRDRVQQGYRLLLSLTFLWVVWQTVPGVHGSFSFLGLDLVPGRADKLSLVFAYVFSLITVIGTIYSLHVKDNVQHVAAYIYAAAAVGVVFAGDLVTLYVFWELMMLASVWLIWRRRTPESYAAGMRYLLVHAVSGVLLLGGIALYYSQTGSIAFDQIDITGPAFYLILVGFMINAAVPPLHAWLTDAYPESTVTGAIFLSALTTKTAVYVLLRGFPGTELLVWLGAIMALWGVVYAVLANDIRRLLAYHIISQVGYMVAGVGMGTAIALNGTASHAFTHILYKALLFMGAGAVIHMTGKSKLTELGGIYRYMPYTFLLYMIGAFSISAFPLFSGFVSKTMVVEAAAVDHRAWIWLMLSMASAGTFLHTGLKLPWFTFMGKDSGLRPKEAPGTCCWRWESRPSSACSSGYTRLGYTTSCPRRWTTTPIRSVICSGNCSCCCSPGSAFSCCSGTWAATPRSAWIQTGSTAARCPGSSGGSAAGAARPGRGCWGPCSATSRV